MSKTIIGIFGPYENVDKKILAKTTELGRLLAHAGWALLASGHATGIIDAVFKGAKEKSGITFVVLPEKDPKRSSQSADLEVITGIAASRSNIINFSCAALVAIGENPQITTEIAYAISSNKLVVILDNKKLYEFFKPIGQGNIFYTEKPNEVVDIIKKHLK